MLQSSRQKWIARPLVTPPVVPAILVLLIAIVVVYAKLALHNFDPMSFAMVDGAFVYELAAAFPAISHAILDVPAYRGQRILLAALAAPAGVYMPWALIAINVLALGAGSYALAKLASRHHMSVWLGLVFGLWLGALFVIELDLTEVLAYALVLWGILFWEEDRPFLTGLMCGLAVLAKETTGLYGVAFLMASGGWGWRARLRFGLLAFGPGLAWQIVLLYTFTDTGLTASLSRGAPAEHMLPLVGLLGAEMKAAWAWGVQIAWVLVPSVVAVGWGAVQLWYGHRSPVAWGLILNGLFVASLPSASTDYLAHSMRLALAVVITLAWAVARTRRPLVVLTTVGLALIPLIFFRPGFYL